MNKSFLILTGGTGGHVIPAVNFGNYLIENRIICKIVTDKRGLKYTAGFKGEVFNVKSSHLSGNIFFKFFAIIKLLFGFFQSFILILKLKPKNIISFGSYASLPGCLSLIILSKFFKINFYIHEQNSIIGKSNRMFIKYTNKFFVNFDKNYKIQKNYQKKIYVVGLPRNKVKIKQKKQTKIFKESVFQIFIYGGSQGSLPVLKIFELILENIHFNYLNKMHFIIQCPNFYKKIIVKKLNNLNCSYFIDEFYFNIEELLQKVDTVISRAGAGTINDIIIHKIPSVLVPLSLSKDNHQYENAQILTKNKSAIIIDEKNHNIKQIIDFIEQLIIDKSYKQKIIDSFDNIIIRDANKLMLKELLND